MRKLVLWACVGLAGAGVAVLPSLGSAQGTTASFTAVDSGQPILELHYWYATGTTNNSVTIAPGGTVSFSYPAGDSSRNVVFTGPQPSACTQTAAPYGYTIGSAPPLPQSPQPAGWSGSCRFDTPGTYPFQDAFASDAVTGTVVVATTTTTPPPTTTQTTTTPPPTTTTFHEPPIPAASSSLRAAGVQHGTTVRGQLHVTAPNSRLVVQLLLGRLKLGQSTIHGVANGTRHFTVSLYASGRKRLRSGGRLSLTLYTQVLNIGLGPTVLTRHVTLLP
ncbi:MAG TPA: hypothetical protein VFR49_06400 [Solirubrobacteraceae bacterium]|nr:hypothetical protein [Solirubrobacteraceae bacterium]